MKRVYILLALLLCAMMAFSAQAVETAAGETVTVPIHVSDSNAAFLQIFISYDSSVFDYVSISCTGPGAQYTGTQMMMYTVTGTISGQVGSITLKVKDNAKVGTYNLSMSYDAFDINENDTSVNLSADPIVVACLHKNTEETKFVEADCENDGIKEVTCKDCGEIVESETTEKLGHDFAEYTESKPATCTEKGEEKSKCTRCDKEDVRELEMIEHEIVVDEKVEPTCTEAGKTEGSHCAVCEEVLVEQEEIPSPGHKEEVMEAKEPTCIEDGLTEGVRCIVCEEVLTEQEAVPALGHTEEKLEAKEPTCIEAGLTEGAKCSVCEEVLVEQEEIPALGHKEGTWTEVTLPSMFAEGLAELKCVVCEEVIETKVLPVLENNVPAPSVQTVKAKKGETVTVNVYVSSNDAQMITAVLNYDSSVFELVSSVCDGLQSTSGRFSMYRLGSVLNGQIGTATLRVKDTATDGIYTLSTSVIEAYDFEERPTVASSAADKVQIINRTPGDVNDDGVVDGRDLLRLAKYVGGYSVTINADNATVNGDSSVDGRDLLRLAKYVGGYSVTLE